jgi:hypothetical protein
MTKQPLQIAGDFDEEVTVEIPVQSMREIVFGEGHAPTGPSRPTRDLRPLTRPEPAFDLSDGVPQHVEPEAVSACDVSDGVPVTSFEHADTEPTPRVEDAS